MDEISPSVSAQQTHAIGCPDRPPVPAPGTPDLIMLKIGFHKHPVLFTIGLFAFIFLYEYGCRQYCDADADTCRPRRKDIMSWISSFFTVLGIRAKYRGALIHETVAAWEKAARRENKASGRRVDPCYLKQKEQVQDLKRLSMSTRFGNS